MILRRLQLCVAAILAAGSVWASSADLMPGSVLFYNHDLWNKAVRFGFDDNGGYTGKTRWYSEYDDGDCRAMLKIFRGEARGYLTLDYDGDAHRSLNVLSQSTERKGPRAANGLKLSSGSLYMDTVVTLSASTEPFERTDERDKFNCWLYMSEDGSVTNFMITAGAIVSSNEVAVTNYVVDAAVAPGSEIHLTVKAVGNAFPERCPGLVGFEVSVDGIPVSSGGTTVFPSAVAPDADGGSYLHSLGLSGESTAQRLNFTHSDPAEDPDYDRDDVSMLQQSALITVDGFPGVAGALLDFPMLVRVSEANIAGFSYSQCSAFGLDIRFTDENGLLIPHEIESWNPGGESIVWVKVPYFRRGAKVTMHWSLAPSTAAPANDRYAVWSEYLGVWHFATDSRGRVSLEDSTGNDHNIRTEGEPLAVESDPMIGASGYAAASTNFVADFSVLNPEFAERFTFTGWYKWNDGFQSSKKIASKNDGNVHGAKVHGWSLVTPATTRAQFYGDASAAVETPDAFADIREAWGHFGLVYDHGSATAYAQACAGETAAMQITLVTNAMIVATPGLAVDELRLTSKARSAEWIAAECMQATNVNFLTYGVGNVKGRGNFWVVEPSANVRPPAVSVEEAHTLVFSPGQPRYGTPVQKFYDVAGNELTAQPTAVGTYKAVTTVAEGVHEGLRHEIAFVIFEKRAYQDIAGHDRIMLFNSDVSAAAPVLLQGYHDVDSASMPVWYHGSDNGDEDPYYYDYWWAMEDYPFVRPGVNHWYYEPDTERSKLLWHFRNCRVGNLYPEDDDFPSRGAPLMWEGFNYLPWGGAGARRIENSEEPCSEPRYAGHLLLRNFSLTTMESEEDEEFVAAAYSPLYTNGIGTVYFDAVNVCYDCINKLKVQYCTFYAEDEPWYPGAGGWKDLPMDVFAIVGGAYDESLSTSGVTTAALAMNDYEGTFDSFYRIRAVVNISTNVRFRIVRDDDSSNMDIDNWDNPIGLIAIDNIIVSNPGMGVKISQYGAPADPDNLTLRGQRAPFDVAFPTAKDLGSMHAQVKVDYIINNGVPIDTTFVGAITFRYRWRYLEQLVNSWRELTLEVDPADPHRWVSTDPILGAGAGDIEYEATAIVNAPFYSYFDYSGLGGWAWPDGFSERYDNQTIDAERDGLYSTNNLSPALGTDYFVRLRDGASEYEGIRVLIRRTNGSTPESAAKEETLDLEPTSDHNWRGYYLVETNGLQNVFYRVEAYNRQTAVGVDYQWNTNYLHGIDQNALPVGDVWEPGGSNVWTRIPCDELTGRIMFQVDDETWAASIIHAEYQNFNYWTDAVRADALFLGTSTEGGTSGVSRLAREYSSDFRGFSETIATNPAYWEQGFDLTGEEVVTNTGVHAVDIGFGEVTTPKGWTASDGMWVCERYRELGGKSLALALNPGNFGWLEFYNSKLPRGVESVTYYARTAQTYDDRPFSYYNCATNSLYDLSAMTFAVPCAMRVTGVDGDFHGLGSVSVVARYRDGLSGYEARADRVASNTVTISIYKWRNGEATLIGTSPVDIAFTGDGERASNLGTRGDSEALRLYGALAISVTNTTLGVRVTAGIMANRGQRINATQSLDDKEFYWMSWEDTDDPYYAGTVGIGSKGCPAVFARPVYSTVPFMPMGAAKTSGEISYWDDQQKLHLVSERELLPTEDDYNNWNIYQNRLTKKRLAESPRNLPGFKAVPLSQTVYLQARMNGQGEWLTLATNEVTSFGFERVHNVFRRCGSHLFRIKIGGKSGGTAVVLDDISVRQWQGENYNDLENPDSSLFWNLTRGAPTNFVYTTAWVAEDDGPLELAPLRTQRTLPMSIRSPLMDGDVASKRGLGLGAFSFRYQNADRHARLLVQVATNGLTQALLADATASLTEYWETVETVTFDEKSEDELAGGLVSCYLGFHGIAGAMRVVVDPTVVDEANDPELNPDRDPSYGRIYIMGVSAKDNPRLDSGSWWGWNLRTTEEGNRQLLKDGDLDPRLHGLSYALNNSVTASTIDGDIYVTHKPFLQTPILTRGSIGEVSFKARKYSPGDPSPSVAIYAMSEYDPAAKDRKFTFLTNIVVNCDRYERFTFMAPVNQNYTAFRFAVTGVEGVEGDGSPDGAGPMPPSGYVRRVLLDEVSVFEALKARLGFRKVGAFRNMLGDAGVVPNVPSRSEQPICNESWGIQAEVYAIRLSEKIDYERAPKVYLHWYNGLRKWGYEKWGNTADDHKAELLPAEEGSMVYRSSLLTCPDAVMQAATVGNTTYQYTLEVVYYMQGQSTALTNFLESTEWSTPDWYRPIDYNVSKGNGQSFAAYTIIDSVPSGWAWINEINLVGLRSNSDGSNSDQKNQYIEVAAPIEANLTGWSLRLLTPVFNSVTAVHTNTIATFGVTSYGGVTLPSTKDIKYAASNMVFFCVGSPLTKDAGVLTPAAGTLDGAWTRPGSAQGAMKNTGEIECVKGLGFQLLRPSGIVEHELVAVGTNFYASGGAYSNAQFTPTNVVRHLNEKMEGAQFFYAGSDESGKGKSLGVFDSFGESSNFWNNTMIETPGRINQFQFINPDHPVPIGSFVTVYFNLLGDHIRQTVGTGVKTNVSQVCVVRKGSAVGTNVVYDVDKWYELAEVSSSDGVGIWSYSPNVRQARVAAAVDSTKNSITVTARAQVSKTLRDLGCDERNRYTPAIIDWLEKQRFLRDVYGIGLDWPDSDGQIYLADFMGLHRKIVAPLTLTQMYWLDICPTISNQCLVAGMASPPTTKIRDGYDGTAAVTNKKMSVFMMLTNAVEDAESPYYAKAWAPYVLRGLEPGSHSLEYGSAPSAGWTNVTFKITGILANGFTNEKDSNAWVPQRYFVFNDNSFSNFLSTVQVPDPHSPRSLGYQFGWGEWWRQRPDDTSAVFFSWAIDTRSSPVSVEVLKSDTPQ